MYEKHLFNALNIFATLFIVYFIFFSLGIPVKCQKAYTASVLKDSSQVFIGRGVMVFKIGHFSSFRRVRILMQTTGLVVQQRTISFPFLFV